MIHLHNELLCNNEKRATVSHRHKIELQNPDKKYYIAWFLKVQKQEKLNSVIVVFFERPVLTGGGKGFLESARNMRH